MEIYVQTPASGIIVNYNANENAAQYFYSDTDGEFVYYDDDQLKIANKNNITTFPQLKGAISKNMSPITIADDIAITAPLTIQDNSATPITITSDATTRTLTRGVNGFLFTVGDGGKLIFENIIIDGGKNSFGNAIGSLVLVDGISANFEMKSGAILQNNNTDHTGGGVRVAGGTFTVGGTAKIQGNTKSDNSANNVYLVDGVFITLNAPATGMSIYVQTETTGGVIVNSGATASMVDYFHPDAGGGAFVFIDGAKLAIADINNITSFPQLKAAISRNIDQTITIGADFSIAEMLNINSAITIKSDGTHTLTRNVAGNLFTVGNNGKLVFDNIIIDGDNLTSNGSLVHVNGSYATFEMRNGAVLKNNVNTGGTGGGVNVTSGTFTMIDGEIIDNTGIGGGGVSVINSSSTFTMSGGIISGNAGGFNGVGGGGVRVGGGTFTMSGGTISENTVYAGGGVSVVNSGTFTMTGGIISENTVNYDGGGVSVDDGTFTVGGTAKILGNTKSDNITPDNVSLASGKYITLGTPQSGMQIYVQTATANNGVIVDPANAGMEQYFHPDDAAKAVIFKDNQIILSSIIMSFAQLQNAIKQGITPITIGTNFNIEAPLAIQNSSEPITIKSDGTTAYTLTRGTVGDLFIVRNNGKLIFENIIIDGNKGVSPYNNNNNASLVLVNGASANFEMKAGAVLQNNKAQNGGGVSVSNSGTFTMKGGTISDNTASQCGGVFVDRSAFTMTGGTISGNTVTSFAGGVCFAGTGVEVSFTVGGTANISGNTNSVSGANENVYLMANNNKNIKLGTGDNAPQSTMAIHVKTTAEDGVIVESGATAGMVDYFHPDAGGGAFVFIDGAKLAIADINNITSFPQLKAAISRNIDQTITIGANFNIAEALTINSAITIKSDATHRTLTRGVNGDLFTVGNNGKLVFENITIDGNKGVYNNINTVLVTVTGSSANFEMKADVVLKNNKISAVYVGHSGTFTMSGGTIRDNTASNGGGVFVNGTFLMTSGTISDNAANEKGGGVAVSGGTFTMSGGEIRDNTAKEGGGVNIYTNGTFIMNDGTISNNTSTVTGDRGYGGGVYVASGSTFTMNDGEISGNTATSDDYSSGGGVSVYGTFAMNGGTISDNTAKEGGGVYVTEGTFTMNNGTISDNTVKEGGGVYVTEGTFTMNNGTISGNKAIIDNGTGGGGVYVFGGGALFTMTDGTISGNTTADFGGGVVLNSGEFTVGGTAKIFENIKSNNNSADNVYLFDGKYITLNSTLANGMKIHVQTPADGVIVNSGADENAAQYFHPDETGKTVVHNGGKLVIKEVIPTAAITLTAPVTSETPSTTATGAGNFNISTVEWTPASTTFLGNTAYTATLTLTANSGYTFKGLTTATINGQTATVTNNENTLTLSYEFPATDQIEVTGITVKTLPELEYIHGTQLDLSDLEVTLTYNYGTPKDVAFDDFGDSISVNISGSLSVTTHNGENIIVQYKDTPHNATVGQLTVSKANPTITFPTGATLTYGETLGEATLSGAYTPTGTFAFATPNYKPSVTESGNFNMTFTPDDTGNYNTLTEQVAVTVNRKALTITADNKSINYDDNPPTYTVSYADFVNDENESVLTIGTITSDYTKGNNAGPYAITPSGYASANYEITHVPGTLTVGKHDLSNATIAGINPFVYNGTAHTPTPVVSYGAIAITASDYTVSYTNNTNVGTATLTLTATANSNYAGTKTANFEITPVPLTITADDISINYGDEPQYTVSYSGFVNGETESVLTIGLITSDYVKGSDVGEYTITPSGYSGNYEITYETGTLTVDKRDLSNVTIAEIDPIVYDSLEHKPVPAVSDGDITITASDYIVSYANNTDIGTATVTLTAVANSNYTGTKTANFEITPPPPPKTILAIITENETIDIEEDEELSALLNKKTYIINDCDMTGAKIQIADADTSISAGIDTVFYNLSQDTAIVISPIPFDKIIKRKWGLLIVDSDPASNGGYELSEYNWFKGGKETGTTLPYYRLDPADNEYMFKVELKTEENIPLNTCEGYPTVPPPPEQQSAYKKQVLGINGKTANGKAYNIKGKFSTNDVPPGVYIVEEKQ